jgi:hypothetical protein
MPYIAKNLRTFIHISWLSDLLNNIFPVSIIIICLNPGNKTVIHMTNKKIDRKNIFRFF